MKDSTGAGGRVRRKREFISSYMNLGVGLHDRWQLAKLAWGRFACFESGHVSRGRSWSARMKRCADRRVHLTPDHLHHLAMFDELFLESAYDLALVPFEPELILDAGAHIGLFSLVAAARWPEASILAFEPHPENARWARRNTVGNGLKCAVIESAVSSQTGWMNFNAGGGMGNLAQDGGLRVSVVDLPALIQSLPTARLLLKMDIEGEEMNLLPKVLPVLPPTCAVFVELHSTGAACDEMIARIQALGFRAQQLLSKGPSDRAWRFLDLFLQRSPIP